MADFDIKTSVSLYSYQEEYYDGRLDLEGCIRAAAEAGATGIELLAEQMIDEFPVITDEFKDEWFGWMDKYGTTPTCYDAFLENHLYWNRTCTLREQIANMERDIKIAHELGFTTLRTLCSTPMDVIEDSLGIAADNDVKICIEVHSPFSLNSGWADGYIEMIERTGTKHFGFMPDWGIFCKRIPDVMRERALRDGCREEILAVAEDAFREREEKGFVKIGYDREMAVAHAAYMKANGFDALMERMRKMGATDAEIAYAADTFMYTWNDPQDIVDNIRYIYHTHAKFYHMLPDATEYSIPIPEVVEAYKRAGYHGYLSSEYEGNRHINDAEEVDSVEQVQLHQKAMLDAIRG